VGWGVGWVIGLLEVKAAFDVGCTKHLAAVKQQLLRICEAACGGGK
jgi:hypothetical protein